SAIEALALAITGTGILDGMTRLTKEAARTVQAIAGLPRPVLLAGAAIAGLVAAIGPLLVVGGKLVALFLQLKLLAAATGVAIGAIAGPIAAAVAAAAGLTAVFIGVARHVAKARTEAEEARAEIDRLTSSLQGRTAMDILVRIGELRKILADRRPLEAIQQDLDTLRGRGLPDWHPRVKALTEERDEVLALTMALHQAERDYIRAAKAAGEATGALGGAAKEAARHLEFTRDNVRRLYEEAARLEEEIADIRFELHFAEAADAVAELTARLET